MERNISNKELSALVSISEDEHHSTTLEIQRKDPISRYIDQILLKAIDNKASDIHFEVYENDYRIRIRCDGILVETESPDKQLANRLSSRIKVMAKLDIAEKRLPQDGRIKHTLSSNTAIDIRVSTLPTLWGEKIVLRILELQSAQLDISTLGLSTEQTKLYLSAIHKPQGLILVTGPTGSGKTVSLYTALKLLNTTEKNISTVEDPIEINLQGINQIQINEKIKLDFVVALKALLRQDPDIIMVGEIRDLESAEIVFKAAQTGHLVLSTLHTNSASESIIRLLNMGIDKYSLASCLSLVVAQRLIRKLCVKCKQVDTESSSIYLPEMSSGMTIFKASSNGCSCCNNGYSGRVGIYELLNVDKTLVQAIENSKCVADIEKTAKTCGFIPLIDSGKRVLFEGRTSLKELQRTLLTDELYCGYGNDT